MKLVRMNRWLLEAKDNDTNDVEYRFFVKKFVDKVFY